MFSEDAEREQFRRAWVQKGKQRQDSIAMRLKLMGGIIVVLLAAAGAVYFDLR